MNLKPLLIPLALTASLYAAACGVGPDKSREDARDTTDVDKSAAHIVAFNNHYANVATKCDGHGHRLYITTSSGRVTVIPDPSCPGYTPQTAAGLTGRGN